MDEELKRYLNAMKQEMQGTKRELIEMLYSTKRELIDHTEAVETRLLGEFWKSARTADARYR
jgi:hypothetical protein